MTVAQSGNNFLKFLLFFFLITNPVLSWNSISCRAFSSAAWAEDAENIAGDEVAVSGSELKDLEKAEKKNQKKLREMNTPILPSAGDSAAEKLRRREEAKERLEYFKRDVEKKREALALSGASAPASNQTEKIPFLVPAVDKREAEALQRESKRREALLAEKERLERELRKSETKEERKVWEAMERARLAEAEKARRSEEVRKKAELAGRKEEEKRRKYAAAAQVKAEQEKSRLEAERKKAEAKRLADLAEAKRKEDAKKREDLERTRRTKEKKDREMAETKKKEELARQKALEKKKRQEEEVQKKAEAKKRAETQKRQERAKRELEEARREEERLKQESIEKQKKETEKKRKKAEEEKRKAEEVDRKKEARERELFKKETKPAASLDETGRKAINHYLKQSQDLLDKGLYGPARVRLERVLKSDPDNVIAKNLMGLAVEGEFVAGQARRKNERQIAREIEEDTMRLKFLDTMDRIDREIRELTEEGNAFYQKEDLAEANIRYRRVMALQAERQTITEGLIEKLKVRQTASLDDSTLSAAQAKRVKTELLMKDAGRLEANGEWNKAAELYESVFTLDPLNSEASRGIDRMKKKFLADQKKKDKVGGERLDADLKGRVDFYLEQAERAKSEGELDVAKVFAEQALTLDQGNRRARGILELIKKGK